MATVLVIRYLILSHIFCSRKGPGLWVECRWWVQWVPKWWVILRTQIPRQSVHHKSYTNLGHTHLRKESDANLDHRCLSGKKEHSSLHCYCACWYLNVKIMHLFSILILKWHTLMSICKRESISHLLMQLNDCHIWQARSKCAHKTIAGAVLCWFAWQVWNAAVCCWEWQWQLSVAIIAPKLAELQMNNTSSLR